MRHASSCLHWSCLAATQVHQERIKKPGKRDLHGHVNELEDYFGVGGPSLDGDDAPQPNKGSADLSATEKFRGLTAYVAHLREEVGEIQQLQPQSSKSLATNFGRAIAGFTVMVREKAAAPAAAMNSSYDFCSYQRSPKNDKTAMTITTSPTM